MATHYEILGVAPSAGHADIRAAYRNLARVNHPDAAGDAGAASMAALNEAWRVLSDPARRAMYDASLRPAATAIGERALPTDDMYRAVPRLEHDARGSRFPVLPLAVSFVVLCALILIFGSRGDKGTAPAADWRIEVGSCVSIRQNLDAVEVGCDAPHDGVVRLLVPFDTSCPIDTETHRDQQGLGNVCVDPVGA